MALITTTEMFKKAYEGGYAIGAFNVNNMEIIQGITEAAKEVNAPLILQVSAGARKDVEYAHDKGVVVEGELGKLAGIEDAVNVSEEDAAFTDPNQVEEFVKRTGVDSLAIAIGTSHGAFKFKGEPRLRFDILEEIQKRLPGFPIVLHGASSVLPEYVEIINKFGGNMPGAKGVPEDMLRKAASMAVCKINIDSDLRLALTASIRKYFAENPSHFDPRQYLSPARASILEVVKNKIINVLGC